MGKQKKSKENKKAEMKSSPAKNEKKSSPAVGKKEKKIVDKEEEEDVVVTMEALKAMSDSDDDSGLPPEEEWDKEARSLKKAIEDGLFNKIAQKKHDLDDDESIEEYELGSDDDSSAEDDQEEEAGDKILGKGEDDEKVEADSDEESESDDGSDADIKDKKVDNGEPSAEEDEDEEDEEAGDDAEPKTAEKESQDPEEVAMNDEDENDESNNPHNLSIKSLNAIRQKPLRALADELVGAQMQLSWPETFDVVSANEMPFGKVDEETGKKVDIHDDLKREVTFYDMALAAAIEGRRRCEQAKIPFTRPEHFFAEMVKTDDHMAKIKDRLIFENKKIEAVSQRKANKEQKLRSKESQSNKIAEKAKYKKDNLKAVDDWAKSAASQRTSRLSSGDDDAGPNKKRMAAEKRWGHGGKKGRFKQTDPKALNDMSDFKSKGSFVAGRKRTASSPGGAGGGGGGGSMKRPGKRARDAGRSRKG